MSALSEAMHKHADWIIEMARRGEKMKDIAAKFNRYKRPKGINDADKDKICQFIVNEKQRRAKAPKAINLILSSAWNKEALKELVL